MRTLCEKKVIAALLCFSIFGLALPVQAHYVGGDHYHIGGDITTPSISTPSDGSFWPINADVDFSCSSASDPDILHYCDTRWHTTNPIYDVITYTWSGPGSFDPTASTSTSTTWTAPGTSGDKTLRVTASDSPHSPGGDDTTHPYDEITVTVVKVDKIQYDDPDDGYVDCTVMYVRKGTTVTFKAIPDPSAATWPSGKPVWGGTSGASGTGGTKAVTFNTISSSLTDYKTVTAECGNTITVDVVVYELVGVFTPEDDFDDRSTEYYGIEEQVGIDFKTDPWSVTAGQAGGLEWTKLSGVGTLTNTGDDGNADYDADETDGVVTLRITVKSGPSKGEFESYGKDIVLPSGTRMTRVNPSNVWHIYNFASAGIKLYYWLDPKNVSFENLTFGEYSCLSTNVSGFYLNCEPWITSPPPPPSNTYPTGTSQAGHTQNTFGAISGGDDTTGCRVIAPDYASSGAADPYAAGSFTWSIPTQYIDDTTTRNTFGSTQNQVSTFTAGGDATQAKGGASDSATLGDISSGF